MQESELPDYKTVVIIGAGPAGLAVGRDLACNGVDFIILEQGQRAGESFTRFPKNIFFGPWLNNLLPGSKVGWTWLLRRATPAAYAYYLKEYALRNHLPIHALTRVKTVEQAAGGFALETSRGRILSDIVINTTGYFSKPYTPDYPGLDSTTIPWIHVANYRSPECVAPLLKGGSGRVLVVGKRLSAGETMCELQRAGYQVALSHRGQLKFGPSPWWEAVLAPFKAVVEKIQVTLQVKMDSFPLMAGGESARLIHSGRVGTRPNILRFGTDQVFFAGRPEGESYDLVVFATGYRPAVDHLSPLIHEEIPRLEKMESVQAPGLFFVGIDNQKTYRSRFLRGIRRDSRVVADLVLERLRGLGDRKAPTSVRTVFTPDEVTIDLDPTETAPGRRTAILDELIR